MKQAALVLEVFLYDNSTVGDLFYCASARSKICIFYCQQFLILDLESVEDISEHGLAGVSFFGQGMTSDCVHSFGYSFVSRSSGILLSGLMLLLRLHS